MGRHSGHAWENTVADFGSWSKSVKSRSQQQGAWSLLEPTQPQMPCLDFVMQDSYSEVSSAIATCTTVLFLTQGRKSLKRVLIVANYYVLLFQKRLEATEIICFSKQSVGAHSWLWMTFLSGITFISMKTGRSHRNSRFFWWGAYKENVQQERFSQWRQNRAKGQRCWTFTGSAIQALSLKWKQN